MTPALHLIAELKAHITGVEEQRDRLTSDLAAVRADLRREQSFIAYRQREIDNDDWKAGYARGIEAQREMREIAEDARTKAENERDALLLLLERARMHVRACEKNGSELAMVLIDEIDKALSPSAEGETDA